MQISNNTIETFNTSNFAIKENDEQILPLINLFLIAFGTFGNLLTLSILTRKNVRKHSYMRYLSSLCIIDTLCLYTWNFSLVYSYFNIENKKIEHEGKILCRIFSFYCYFILQSSSWVICSIGMDRIITLIFRNKTNLIFLITKHSYTIVILVLLAFLWLNFLVLIKNAESVESNQLIPKEASSYSCYEPKSFYVIWDIVHIIMYSIMPFFVLVFENITLNIITVNHEKKINLHCKSMSYQTKRLVPNISDYEFRTSWKEKLAMKFDKKRRFYRKSVNIQNINLNSNKYSEISLKQTKSVSLKKKKQQIKTKGLDVSKLLIFLNVSFIFTTVPYSSFYALKLNFIINQEKKQAIIGVLAFLQYTRHSANFLIYLLTSSILKNELKKIRQVFIKKFSFLT